MSAIPKALLTTGARILSARTSRRLNDPRRILPAQQKTFSRLTSALAQCSFGRADGIHSGMTYTQFQATIPLRAYEQFIDPIERMKRGQPDVLSPGRCSYFAVSSGTTAGRTKYLPVTSGMLDHFRQAGLDSLLYYTARTGKTSIFGGKHLFLGGSTTLARIDEAKPFEAWAGDLSGITALHLPGWVDHHLYEPGAAIAQIGDWPEKIRAIAERTHNRDIRLVAGIPSWVLILAAAVRARAGANPSAAPVALRSIWPRLECLVHGGVPIAPFVDELRATLGEGVDFHEVYPASEGFIATQDADASLGLRLMTDVGLFFEFLPLSDFDETRLDQLGPKAVPLEGAKAGVDYALVLTTPAGLFRYVIGDVVRFVSTDVPRLVYAGRTRLQLSAFGEHVIEKELTDALATVCQRHGWNIANFHVAPLFVDPSAGRHRGCHEWWIEFSTAAPAGADATLSREIDAELMRSNDDYEAKRKGVGLEPPAARLVVPGVFEQWMRAHGKWGGQSKMPRCRSDREIADGLAIIAQR